MQENLTPQPRNCEIIVFDAGEGAPIRLMFDVAKVKCNGPSYPFNRDLLKTPCPDLCKLFSVREKEVDGGQKMKKIKMHYLDPQEPLHDGIQNKRRISKEEALKTFPTEVIQNQIPAIAKGRKNEKN